VSRMNKKAMEDYDSLEFDSARKTLVDAVAMLRANGVDETPLAAKTYINLGIVYIAGFKDVNRGKQQFVNALKINPDAKLDPALATPELEEAFEAARKQAGVKRKTPVTPPPPEPKKEPPPQPKKEPPPPPPKHEEPPPPPPKHEEPPPPEPPAKPEPPPEPEPPSPDEVKGLQHNPVDEVRPNQPILVKALLGNDVGATKLFLFFRGSGQEDYVSLAMKHTKGAEYVARSARASRRRQRLGAQPVHHHHQRDGAGGRADAGDRRRRGRGAQGAPAPPARGGGEEVGQVPPPLRLPHAGHRPGLPARRQPHRGRLAAAEPG
jgi:hypothetical protein